MKMTDDRCVEVTGNKTRIEQAETRTEEAETRTEQAKTRAELAETRTEQAETRTELAKTRTEQAEIRAEQAETRAEQAETSLERALHERLDLRPIASAQPIVTSPSEGNGDKKGRLDQLTGRQRQILQLIAEGRNTKEIAGILEVSPKTVAYHRKNLTDRLNVHDIPGLVRFALRVGLISPEG